MHWCRLGFNFMSEQPPITHGGTDRGYKVCQCSECGIVHECTPRFDFYTRFEAGLDSPLVCERCLIQNRLKPENN